MSQKINYHQQYIGNDHGEISFGNIRTANQIAAFQVVNKHDAGRHYIIMQETGDKNVGIRGGTKIYAPNWGSGVSNGIKSIYNKSKNFEFYS